MDLTDDWKDLRMESYIIYTYLPPVTVNLRMDSFNGAVRSSGYVASNCRTIVKINWKWIWKESIVT